MSNVQSYNALIDRFKAFASGHFILKTFSHGQIDTADLEKFTEYPFMHVVPSNVTYAKGTKTFSFQIVLADLPRDKDDKVEFQREVLSDLQRIAEDLVAEITNHRVLFGDLITVQNVSLEPFLEEFHNTLTGWTVSLDLLVPYYWDACSIPAEWNDFFESGSGGTGSILTFIDSITRDNNGNVSLVNDEETPAASYYYGTDGEGVRGWFALPEGGGLTCETIGSCQTIIDIEAAIDALEEEILLKADITSISAVGFSNNYNDLDNKPTIPTALPPNGAAGGDLSGTYPNPTVHRVHGVDFQSGAPAVDDTWIYVSTPLGPQPFQWQHSKLKTSQVQNDSTVTGTNADDALEHLDTSKVATTRTISTTAPLSGGGDLTANRTLSIPQATTSVDGYLSAADWTTFNSKQATLVSGTNIKTINGSTVLGSGNLVVGGTQVGFKYNISVYSGGNPLPAAASGQAIILFYDDGSGAVFEGLSIHPTDANGLDAPSFILTELGKQPLTLFINSTSYTTFNNTQAVTFAGGAYRVTSNDYRGTDASTLHGQVGYFDFGTSNSGTVTSVAALTLGTSGADLSSTVANGTSTPIITLNVPTASAANRGALSAADWATFNGKQDALGFTAENTANKQNSLAVDGSGLKFPTVDAVNSLSFIDKGKRMVSFFTDFLTNATLDGAQSFASGGSLGLIVGAQIPNRTNQQGVAFFQTNIIATNYINYCSSSGAAQLWFGGGAWNYEALININTLSTALERYRVIFGFGSVISNSAETDGVFITYDEGGTANGTVASANWQCVSVANSVRTLTTSTTAVTAAAWNKLRIEINAAGTSVTFYVNGTAIATHTTNIPLASNSRYVLMKTGLVKTIGTTTRGFYCDYIGYENILTTAR